MICTENMKKKKITRGKESLEVIFKKKKYAVNLEKLKYVLGKIGFDCTGIKQSSDIILILRENKMLNREFIEFISY